MGRNVVWATAFAVAMLPALAGSARADGAWSCSIIDDGKPQVLKIVSYKGKATVSDWRGRLVSRMMGKTGDEAAKIIKDDKDALIVTSEVRMQRESGQTQNVSVDVFAIDKKQDVISVTTVSTATPVSEVKGNCVQ